MLKIKKLLDSPLSAKLEGFMNEQKLQP